jgi:hypothetical protein
VKILATHSDSKRPIEHPYLTHTIIKKHLITIIKLWH